MSTAKINIKNIDYFKYRKLVVDGCRDDYAACSREVRALCDAVQTLSFRDDEFDDPSDRSRLADIGLYYRQILAAKRVDPVDMRLKSGWWGDPSRTVTGYSAGKIKQTMLLEVLASKTRDWILRHSAMSSTPSVSGGGQAPCVEPIEEKIDGPGLYVFKHRERQCFQIVGIAAVEGGGVFARCAERLKAAFDGAPASGTDPLAALLVISLASDWDFYFVPVATSDGQRLLRILENDLILKHDTIWPHGLNNTLHIETPVEVAEFRRSCLRHRWPPEYDTAARPETELDLNRLRRQIDAAPPADLASNPASVHSSAASTPVGSTPTNTTATRNATSGNTHSSDSSTSRGSHHHDETNIDRPVTPSKKQTSSTRSSTSGSSAPSKSGSGSDQQPSSTSKPTSTKTTSAGTHRPATVVKETPAGTHVTDMVATGKATSAKSPTKRPSEKHVAVVASLDTAATTKSISSGKPAHDANESTVADIEQPLKRSGTFTSVPAAVDAEEECNFSAPVSATGRMTSRLPVTSTGAGPQQA